MGLGPLALYGLQEARQKALDARRLCHGGIDPIKARCAQRAMCGYLILWPGCERMEAIMAIGQLNTLCAAAVVAMMITVSPAVGAGPEMDDSCKPCPSWRSPASSDMPPVVPGAPHFPEDFRRVGSLGGAKQNPRLPSRHVKIAGKSLGESRGESKRNRAGQIVPSHVPRWFARDHASNQYRSVR
jgi:hypothetical protein